MSDYVSKEGILDSVFKKLSLSSEVPKLKTSKPGQSQRVSKDGTTPELETEKHFRG